MSTKMKEGECRCTVKKMQYCKTPEGVRFTGKCPPTPKPKKEQKQP